ncbi:hypothetical protein N0V93_007722 [Gnomoniopsis smithogilvyi]|uniref:Uncharacterized protein n=1 Tax=Gnomoniopsis smithogilvyi TaxID=1191159 RepID=A0A9W8YLM8_9PEZI|nr:hypothetical protein N0V93_007722 [Gnomoniopsis smithogilvyi]
MTPSPLILSPALPSELLAYIIQYESHPTTLLMCCSRAEFVSDLVSDVQKSRPHPVENKGSPSLAASTLLSSPLYQVAIARHIRVVFIPTVSHLRAYLSVFSPADSKIPPPPNDFPSTDERLPLLLVYGFLGLHRDTSEWSAQGISATAAGFVEAARKNRFKAVVVDPPLGSDMGEDEAVGERASSTAECVMFEEEMPVLSASVVRVGVDFEDAAWTGRRVSVDRVLGRWFQYQQGAWSRVSKDDKEIMP